MRRRRRQTLCGLIDDVVFGAVFQRFPSAREPSGDDKGVAGNTLHDRTVVGLESHPALGQHTVLMLGVLHAPAAYRAGPESGVETAVR